MLVVDDDDVSRLAAGGLLQSLGFTVDAAGDGREALEMSAQWPYVAIFMDCAMPDVDGYTAARQLRARAGRSSHTPVIAMTSKLRSVSLASGMDHHMTKPLEIDLLRADCGQLGLLGPDGAAPSGSVEPLGAGVPLLDPSIFPKTAARDRAPRATAVAFFIKQTTARLPEIWRLINSGDGPALKRLAHTLRDAAIIVGTQRIAYLCERLSETGADGVRILAANIEQELRGVLAETGAAIKAYAEGVSSMDSPAVQAVSPTDAAVAREKDQRSDRPGIGGGLGLDDTPSGDSPLDEAGVQRLQSEFGSTGLLAELVDLFGSQISERLSEMRSANEAGDAAAVSASAHQLKGGCLTLAAVHMAELCEELELTAGGGSLVGAETLVDKIESEFGRAYAALTAIASPPSA